MPTVKQIENVPSTFFSTPIATVSLNYTLDGRQVTGARRVRIESLLVMIDACCEGS
jgi:hypothetical protein